MSDCPHRTLVEIVNGLTGCGDSVWVCVRCDASFADQFKAPLRFDFDSL